ncbi:MAG TPA: hypothetical protein VIT65_06405 [Microlunatus sp.]
MERVRLTRELRSEGYDPAELARLRRSGTIRSVRRGAYVMDSTPIGDQDSAHWEQIKATVGLLSTPAVVSHMSAALLHGLPLWNAELGRVHLIRDRANGGHVDDLVHLHVMPLALGDVTEIDGIAVTSLARTVCDLARTLSTFKAVPIGDAALARGLYPVELTDVLARCRGWRGVVRARRTIDFLDARSESPGESCSRVILHEQGLPKPDLQVEIYDDHGYFLARSDFGWIEGRTLGEFDGQGKYGALRRPEQCADDVVLDEKAREDRLRDHGWQVARWNWPVLRTPIELRKRVERAFARAHVSP